MRTLPWLILLGGLAMQPAWADHHRGGERGPPPRQEERRGPQQWGPPQHQREFAPRNAPQFARPNDFSPGDAARRAQQMNGGGRVLSIDPNGPGYRVKVLKEGEVRVFAVPGG